MYCLCHLWGLFSDLLLAGWPMHDAFFLQSDESVQRRERDNGIFWYYIEIFRMHNFFSWDQGFFPKTFVFSLDVNILCLPWKGNEIRTSHGIERGENLYSNWRTGFGYLWNFWDSWYFYWIFGSIDFFYFFDFLDFTLRIVIVGGRGISEIWIFSRHFNLLRPTPNLRFWKNSFQRYGKLSPCLLDPP